MMKNCYAIVRKTIAPTGGFGDATLPILWGIHKVCYEKLFGSYSLGHKVRFFETLDAAIASDKQEQDETEDRLWQLPNTIILVLEQDEDSETFNKIASYYKQTNKNGAPGIYEQLIVEPKDYSPRALAELNRQYTSPLLSCQLI